MWISISAVLYDSKEDRKDEVCFQLPKLCTAIRYVSEVSNNKILKFLFEIDVYISMTCLEEGAID